MPTFKIEFTLVDANLLTSPLLFVSIQPNNFIRIIKRGRGTGPMTPQQPLVSVISKQLSVNSIQ